MCAFCRKGLRNSFLDTKQYDPPRRSVQVQGLVATDDVMQRIVQLSGTCARRQASVTLEELGVPYAVRPISLGKNEQKEDWFLKMNPNGCAASCIHLQCFAVTSEAVPVSTFGLQSALHT